MPFNTFEKPHMRAVLLGMYGAGAAVIAGVAKSAGGGGEEEEDGTSQRESRGAKELSMKAMNNQRVKEIVIEIYGAAVEVIKQSLACVKKSPIPLGWFSVDLWTSKASNEKYIGMEESYRFMM